MSYYENNREDRLEYQREYHEIHHDKYVDYQKWYYQNVLKKKRISVKNPVEVKIVVKEKPTKITEYFLRRLERLCLRKIQDYNDTIEAEKEAIRLSNADKPFEGVSIVNGKFRLTFN